MIYSLVNDCIISEKERGLSEATIKELKRYLHEFAEYFQKKLTDIENLTSDFLRQYVEHRGNGQGPDLVKAVVWSLRKFGAFLVLTNILSVNPAKPLRHPKIHPRNKLPKYLKKDQLRTLLKSAAENMSKIDFVILSLICSTGMRPFALAKLRRRHFIESECVLIEQMKGGGTKRTPLNASVTALIHDYLADRDDDLPALFLSNRKRPVSISYIQRMVKEAGEKAGLANPLNCNQLRHTFAVYASDRHGKLLTKALLGHQRLSTTAVYTHLSARHFNALMNKHPYQSASLRSLP